MKREEAARYIGVDPGAFNALVETERMMKNAVLGVSICTVLAACQSGPNHSISHDLRRGMTEQQLSDASNGRVPERIIMRTCGTETPRPFPCKVYVYQGAPYERKLSVVFEDLDGQWKVAQWL